MSLISKLLDVYNGTTDPDVVIDVWFNLSAGSSVGDVAYILKSQGERYEVKQKVTKYYVWDGSEWISEIDAIARVSESANTPNVTKTVNSNYTANDKDDIYADASLGSFTITLPDPSTSDGFVVNMTKIDSSNNKITVKAISGFISTETEIYLKKQVESFRIACNGSNWWVK